MLLRRQGLWELGTGSGRCVGVVSEILVRLLIEFDRPPYVKVETGEYEAAGTEDVM